MSDLGDMIVAGLAPLVVIWATVFVAAIAGAFLLGAWLF
jgi:hypothetical protein